MNQRLPVVFAIAALPLALAACKPQQEVSAPPGPAAGASITTTSTTTTATSTAASAGITGPLPDVPKFPPVAHEVKLSPVEGKDYVVVANGATFEPADDKIEVVEVFNYICPACAALEGSFAPWAASLPADVRVVHVPAVFSDPRWVNYARAFTAAQAMNVAERTHEVMYDEIHRDKKLQGEHGQDTMDDIAAAYGRHGVDPAAFKATASSFAIEGKLAHAKQFALDHGVEGTPTVIVDGKYRITPKQSLQDNLPIADALIAKVRAERGRK